MKTLNQVVFLFLMILAFSSCNKDDNNAEPSLIGSWKLTSMKINGNLETLDECELKIKYNFSDTIWDRITYSGSDCEFPSIISKTYRVVDNYITYGDGTNGPFYKITKLNRTSLELTLGPVLDFEFVETFIRQ